MHEITCICVCADACPRGRTVVLALAHVCDYAIYDLVKKIIYNICNCITPGTSTSTKLCVLIDFLPNEF